MKQLVQRVELDAIADRKLPSRQQQMRDLEDELYFVIDEKGHSVHLTDQGAASHVAATTRRCSWCPTSPRRCTRSRRTPSLSPADGVDQAPARSSAAYAAKSETLHIIHKLLQAYVAVREATSSTSCRTARS